MLSVHFWQLLGVPAIFIFVVAGCGEAKPTVNNPQSAGAQQQTGNDVAIDGFRKVSENFKGCRIPFGTNESGTTLFSNPTNDVSFDVKKSDSLVSPLIGVIIIKFERPNTARHEITLQYAYQDQQWVFKDSAHRYQFIGDLVEKGGIDGSMQQSSFKFTPGMEKR